MNTRDSISFQPPFHSMCIERQGWLLERVDEPELESESNPNSTSKLTTPRPKDWIDFDQLNLTQMPDVIVIGDRHFKYAGTSDGRGFYTEQEQERS